MWPLSTKEYRSNEYHLEWAGYPFLSTLPIEHFGHMKTIHQFTMNRQFFKIILNLVHTRYQKPLSNYYVFSKIFKFEMFGLYIE